MTRDEIRKRFAYFGTDTKISEKKPENAISDDWTEEEILTAAKKIMKRLGIEEPLSDWKK